MILTLLVVVALVAGAAYLQSKYNLVSTVTTFVTKVVTFVEGVVAKIKSLFTKQSGS